MNNYCKQCETITRTIDESKPVNHILHLLLAIITIGFWIPVWIIITAFTNDNKYICNDCGYEVDDKIKKEFIDADFLAGILIAFIVIALSLIIL